MFDDDRGRPRRQPAVNIPGAVIGLVLAFVVVHLARLYLLSPQGDADVLLRYAFIPARYSVAIPGLGEWPGGFGAKLWTPLTYAFLHGGWTHLTVNGLWLVVFGTALGRRFGSARFLTFSAVCAIAGAGAHYLAHPTDAVPVVGASAAIAGQMAAAARFMFSRIAPIGPGGRLPGAYRQPALSLLELLRTPRALAFLAIWFVLNFGAALGTPDALTGGNTVAWEAHIGGFLAGLLLFPLFDPVATGPRAHPPSGPLPPAA